MMLHILENLVLFIQGVAVALFLYFMFDYKKGKTRFVFMYLVYIGILTMFTFYRITPDFTVERHIMPAFIRGPLMYFFIFFYAVKVLKLPKKRSAYVILILIIIEQISEKITITIMNVAGSSDKITMRSVYVLNTDLSSIYNLEYTRFFGLIINAIVYFGLFYIAVILNSKITDNIKKWLIATCIILPIGQIVIVVGLFKTDNNAILSYGIIFLICMLVVNIILFNVIEYFQKLAETEISEKYLLTERENQYDYYKLVKRKANELSQIKHDLKNQIQTALILAENEQKSTQSINMLNKIDGKIDDVDKIIYCNNNIINAILCLKSAEAKKFGIRSNIKISNIDNITIDEVDLTSIFSNLYDNSIEALKDSDIADKYIDISVLESKGYLTIRFINPIDKKIVVRNKNKVSTTKVDKKNHGFGLKQVNSISKKHDGDVKILTENNKFQITIHLKL